MHFQVILKRVEFLLRHSSSVLSHRCLFGLSKQFTIPMLSVCLRRRSTPALWPFLCPFFVPNMSMSSWCWGHWVWYSRWCLNRVGKIMPYWPPFFWSSPRHGDVSSLLFFLLLYVKVKFSSRRTLDRLGKWASLPFSLLPAPHSLVLSGNLLRVLSIPPLFV